MTKPEKFQATENKPYIEAMREIRRSSAASPQDSRPNRERSRAAAKSAAIRREREVRA